MTKLVPGANDFALLQPLQWNTRYEVEITARNVKGLSEPTFYQFFMPQKPDITGKNRKTRCFGCFLAFLAACCPGDNGGEGGKLKTRQDQKIKRASESTAALKTAALLCEQMRPLCVCVRACGGTSGCFFFCLMIR